MRYVTGSIELTPQPWLRVQYRILLSRSFSSSCRQEGLDRHSQACACSVRLVEQKSVWHLRPPSVLPFAKTPIPPCCNLANRRRTTQQEERGTGERLQGLPIPPPGVSRPRSGPFEPYQHRLSRSEFEKRVAAVTGVRMIVASDVVLEGCSKEAQEGRSRTWDRNRLDCHDRLRLLESVSGTGGRSRKRAWAWASVEVGGQRVKVSCVEAGRSTCSTQTCKGDHGE